MRFLAGPELTIGTPIGPQSRVGGGGTVLPPAPLTAPPAPVTAPPAPVTVPPAPVLPPDPGTMTMPPPLPVVGVPPVPASSGPPLPAVLPAQPTAPKSPARHAAPEIERRAFIGRPPGLGCTEVTPPGGLGSQ